MYFKKAKIKNFLILGLLILSCPNCNKDSTSNRVPYVPVNLIINANDLLTIPIGATKSYPGGNDSIYVYHSDLSSFIAYDRLCTNYPNDTSAVVTDIPGGTTATCPRCKSRFELIYGSVLKGPAPTPLKQYQANMVDGRLYITN